MRYIDIHRLAPDAQWTQKATQEQVLITGNHAEPDAYAASWRALRDKLETLSAGKCFYCEARLTRASYDVDHFRPKSLYRFLALVPANFRLACQFCNRPRTNPANGRVEGKSNHFPLLHNVARAQTEEDIDRENPALLDPCDPADPPRLGFNSDGMACAADPEDASDAVRVSESIRLYALNEPRVIEARREVKQLIDEAVAGIMRTLRHHANPIDRQPHLTAYARQLQQRIRHDAEFAAFARQALRTHRGKPLVERILDTA